MMFTDFFRKVSTKMTKPKKKRAKKDGSPKGPKTKKMVECNCTLRCNGSKLVDPRTFKTHQREMERIRAITSGSQGSSQST